MSTRTRSSASTALQPEEQETQARIFHRFFAFGEDLAEFLPQLLCVKLNVFL